MTLQERLQEIYDDLFVTDEDIQVVVLEEKLTDLIAEVGELEYRMESLEK